MDLPKTSLNVIYKKPEVELTERTEKYQLQNFIVLFAKLGFEEISLNENSTIFREFAAK